MNVKPVLARLKQALGPEHSTSQMLLIPGTMASDSRRSPKAVNFVVAYNGSADSQAALDLTLWIAHQTRRATGCSATVHVVYVSTSKSSKRYKPRKKRRKVQATSAPKWRKLRNEPALLFPLQPVASLTTEQLLLDAAQLSNEGSPVQTITHCLSSCPSADPVEMATDELVKADCILWQARCLAEEWRGSLEAHLRFGDLTTELQALVETLSADLLVLGCYSAKHPLVRHFPLPFPCPVLGLPMPADADSTLM